MIETVIDKYMREWWIPFGCPRWIKFMCPECGLVTGGDAPKIHPPARGVKEPTQPQKGNDDVVG